MNKNILILKNNSENIGVAKIHRKTQRSILSINLEKSIDGRKKCIVVSDGKKINVGSFYKKRSEFTIQPDLNIENVIIEDDSEAICWSGNQVTDIISEQNPPPNTNDITFENFMGGGFFWRKIRGNFILYNYSILHHIFSQKNVYKAINSTGYYKIGIRENDSMKIIAIALRSTTELADPFSEINADVYTINSEKKTYKVICVGIDKSGEFFISM